MKTKINLLLLFILFLLFFSLPKIFSQTLEWREIPGIPLGVRYDDLYFTDANTGWVIGYNKLYKTTNSGATWAFYERPGSNRSIGFFDNETGIIGTLDTSKVLSRTTNGGENWTIVSGLPDPKPSAVCGISIVDESCAYFVGAYYEKGRAYKTTDKGQTWTVAFNDSSIARTLVDCYFWSRDSGIIAGGYNTSSVWSGKSVIALTTNGGTDWQRVYISERTSEWCWKISFNKSFSENSGVVSIQSSNNNEPSYILKTTDKGFHWTEIPFMVYEEQGIGFLNENTGWVGGFGKISGNDSSYMTTDGGLVWKKAGWGTNLNRIRFINDTLAFASGSKAYKYSRDLVGIPFVSTEIPSGYDLRQNFPNPFNPITLIKFDIPKNSRQNTVYTTLVIYDALGKEIRKLIHHELEPGSYQVSFDGGYFPSGIYFYSLESGEFKMTKSMMLLK